MQAYQLPCLFVLISTSLQAQQPVRSIIDKNNPFAQHTKSNQITEPNGLIRYSFTRKPNQITELEPDRQYIIEARETAKYGRVSVDASRISDLSSVIQYRVSHQAKQRAQFTTRNAQKGSKDKVAVMYAKTLLPDLPLASNILSQSKNILSYGTGTYIGNKGWDTKIDVLTHKVLGNIIIERWAHKAANGGVILDSDAVNISIASNPGVFIVRTADNISESVLNWVDQGISYSIHANTDLGGAAKKSKLIELASELTKANHN